MGNPYPGRRHRSTPEAVDACHVGAARTGGTACHRRTQPHVLSCAPVCTDALIKLEHSAASRSVPRESERRQQPGRDHTRFSDKSPHHQRRRRQCCLSWPPAKAEATVPPSRRTTCLVVRGCGCPMDDRSVADLVRQRRRALPRCRQPGMFSCRSFCRSRLTADISSARLIRDPGSVAAR